jgi:hypothetical protein
VTVRRYEAAAQWPLVEDVNASGVDDEEFEALIKAGRVT